MQSGIGGILLVAVFCGATCAWAQSLYKETTPLPEIRQMHGAAVLGDYLYVFGGNKNPEGYTQSVNKAPINPDGSLGEWSDTTPLPSRRSYIPNSTLALNDIVYIVGGLDGATEKKFNTAIWSRPMADGNLEPWQESPPFGPHGLSNLTVVSTQGFLHVLGGFTEAQIATATVFSGVVSPSGGIVTWEAGPAMPAPLWFHNAAALGGRVWVWGGLYSDDRSSASSQVYSSPILSSGRIGPWRQEPVALPVPFYSAASATAGSYIISFCPRRLPNEPTDELWFTTVSPEGLNPWQCFSSRLPVRLYIAAAPDYRRGNVYVTAGRTSSLRAEDVEKRVFYFQLAPHARMADTAGAPAQGPTPAPGTAPGSAATATAQAALPTPETPPWGSGVAQPGVAKFTYMSQSSLPQGAVKGFLSYEDARKLATSAPTRPLVLYFHLQTSRPCIQQLEQLNDPQFAALTEQAAFAWIDIREWPQMAQQLGVFRAPTWIFYDIRGIDRGRPSQVLSVPQIAQIVSALR
jgi:hypothetical protein